MGSGQAEDAVEIRFDRQVAGDLGLFAAHYVGGFCLFDATDDLDRYPPVAAGRADRRGTGRRFAGDGFVFGFGPALTGADHAAGKHRRDTIFG